MNAFEELQHSLLEPKKITLGALWGQNPITPFIILPQSSLP